MDSCQTEVAEFIGVNCLQSSLSSCSSRPARAASASHRVRGLDAMRCCFSIRLARRRDADAMRRHRMPSSLPRAHRLPDQALCQVFPWCHNFLFSQFLTQLHASIASGARLARSSVIVRPASLKLRSHSADIAGIDNASKASRDRLGHCPR